MWMPSFKHDSTLFLFRNGVHLAADLLRKLNVELPGYDTIRCESSDLSDLQPAEYRADLVLFLERDSHKEFGIIVEMQLARDPDKVYAWPAYVANLRARHRCPVCLLVITTEDDVARWAGRPIDLGPGSRCNPWVIGPANTPAITDLQEAEENVELAVLSMITHAGSADAALKSQIASAAIVASTGVGVEEEISRLYLDLILTAVLDFAPTALEVTMKTLGFNYEYQSEFARRYYGKGKAEGNAEGRASIVIEQLNSRFGALTDADRSRVSSAHEQALSEVAQRVLTARTLEEALSPLS
jgi:hypothetical protein